MYCKEAKNTKAWNSELFLHYFFYIIIISYYY